MSSLNSFIPTPDAPVDHSVHHNEAEGVVIQVENKLYWANKNDLIRYCGLFADAFMMAGYVQAEGTIEKPLQFNDRITADMFEPFLTWLWEGARGEYSAQDLEKMLLLTTAWDAPVARAFCLQRLVEMKPSPFYQIRIVMPYKERPDLRNAIIAAINSDISEWPMDNPPIDKILMRLKIQLQEVRRNLVGQVPPVIVNPNCTSESHTLCKSWWEDDWRKYVAEPVFRTKDPMPLDRAYEVMKQITIHSSLCRKDALNALRDNEEFLSRENNLINEAVQAVESHLTREALLI